MFKKIYDLLCEVRLNRDIDVFLIKAKQIRNSSSCYSAYSDYLSNQNIDFDSLKSNTDRLIDKAQNLIYSYIEEKFVLEDR